jgi:hypothetical protein
MKVPRILSDRAMSRMSTSSTRHPTFLDRLLWREDLAKGYLSDLERLLNDSLPLQECRRTIGGREGLESEDEAANIARLLIEQITGFDPRVAKVEVKDLTIEGTTLRCTILLTMRVTMQIAERACRAEYSGEQWVCQWSEGANGHDN